MTGHPTGTPEYPCPDCGGFGTVVVADGAAVEDCVRCDALGFLPPPLTPEEEARVAEVMHVHRMVLREEQEPRP